MTDLPEPRNTVYSCLHCFDNGPVQAMIERSEDERIRVERRQCFSYNGIVQWRETR